MLSKLKRRLRPLYFYLFYNHKKSWVTKTMLFKYIFSKTCENFASTLVKQLYSDEEYVYYKVSNYPKVFSYPKQVSFHSFAQVVSEGLNDSDWHYYEIPETKVTEQDIILDCGAAEGYFSYKYQNLCKKIYVVEPLPLYVKSLQKLFKDDENVEILPLALSDKLGSIYMMPNSIASICKEEINFSEYDSYIKVNCTTIDAEFADKNKVITYIKADLEGFEENMIRGALKSIKLFKPKIAITTYHEGQDYQKLINLVLSVNESYKYKLKGIESVAGRPVMLHMWCDE